MIVCQKADNATLSPTINRQACAVPDIDKSIEKVSIVVKMPSQAQIKDRYRSAIPVVSGRYKTGVEGATGWKDASLAGQNLYEQQMQNASVLKRREAGIQKSSDQTWKQNALGKGVNRISEGMTAAVDKQAQGYEPCRAAMEGLNLAARTNDSNSNIDNRVKPVVAAMKNAVGH